MSKAAWTAVAMAVALTTGCKQAPETGNNVRQALAQANIKSVEVAVDDNEGIVHLKGIVPTLADPVAGGGRGRCGGWDERAGAERVGGRGVELLHRRKPRRKDSGHARPYAGC